MTTVLVEGIDDTTAGVLSNTTVKINEIELRGCNASDISIATEIASQPISGSAPITDHVVPQGPEFSIEAVFTNEIESTVAANRISLYTALKTLIQGASLITFTSDFGTFDDMVVTAFTVKQSTNSSNSFVVSMSLKQIYYAVYQTESVQVVYDYNGDTVGVTPPGSTSTTDVTLTDPTPVKKKGFWEELADAFNLGKRISEAGRSY